MDEQSIHLHESDEGTGEILPVALSAPITYVSASGTSSPSMESILAPQRQGPRRHTVSPVRGRLSLPLPVLPAREAGHHLHRPDTTLLGPYTQREEVGVAAGAGHRPLGPPHRLLAGKILAQPLTRSISPEASQEPPYGRGQVSRTCALPDVSEVHREGCLNPVGGPFGSLPFTVLARGRRFTSRLESLDRSLQGLPHRPALVGASGQQCSGEDDLGASDPEGDAYRCLRRDWVGCSVGEHDSSAGLLEGASEATPHHLQGAHGSQIRGGVLCPGDSRHGGEAARGQPGSLRDAYDRYFEVTRDYAGTEKALPPPGAPWDYTETTVHSVPPQHCCGQAVEDDRFGGLDVEPQVLPTGSRQVGTSSGGPLCHSQQSSGSPVQFQVQVPGDGGHGLLQPELESGSQLAQSALDMYWQVPGQTSQAGRQSNDGGSLLDIAVLVADAHGDGGRQPVLSAPAGLVPARGPGVLSGRGKTTLGGDAGPDRVSAKYLDRPRVQQLLQRIRRSWVASMALEGVPPDTPGMDGLLQMVTHSLAPSTFSGYADKFEQWIHYCTVVRSPPCPFITPLNYTTMPHLQTTAHDVHLWMGYLFEKHSVHPGNFASYISVVNTIHRLCCVPPPVSFDKKGSVTSKISKGGVRLRVWGSRAGAPSLDTAGRRMGHDVLEEDQLAAFFAWASGKLHRDSQIRAAAFVALGLVYFARDDTHRGISFEHVSWGGAGLRLFESRHKGHAESIGVRVLFTPWSGPRAALVIIRRYVALLEVAGVGPRWPLWQLPGEKVEPDRGSHSDWMRQAFVDAGVHIPFGFRIHPHMLRATAICHSLAIGIAPQTVAARAGHESLASLNNYARAVFSGPTSSALFGFLQQLFA